MQFVVFEVSASKLVKTDIFMPLVIWETIL
jgi:hypothetical protein